METQFILLQVSGEASAFTFMFEEKQQTIGKLT